MTVDTTTPVLIVSARARVCALRIADVIETMRPLLVEPLAGALPFVRGMSIIRSVPTPVIDLGELLGSSNLSACTRFVTVRANHRPMALAIDSVLGLYQLDSTVFADMPSLLDDTHDGVIEALATLDQHLLLLLRTARLLPAAFWHDLDTRSTNAGAN